MIVWALGNDILQPLWYFSCSRAERNRISRYSKFLSTILCTFEQRNICFQLVFYFVSSNAISIFTHHFAKIQTPLTWMSSVCSEYYYILSQITKSVEKESAKQLFVFLKVSKIKRPSVWLQFPERIWDWIIEKTNNFELRHCDIVLAKTLGSDCYTRYGIVRMRGQGRSVNLSGQTNYNGNSPLLSWPARSLYSKKF